MLKVQSTRERLLPLPSQKPSKNDEKVKINRLNLMKLLIFSQIKL
jgi:hypothetical protein